MSEPGLQGCALAILVNVIEPKDKLLKNLKFLTNALAIDDFKTVERKKLFVYDVKYHNAKANPVYDWLIGPEVWGEPEDDV